MDLIVTTVFTFADVTITKTIPSNNSSNAAVNTNVTIFFNIPINNSTISIDSIVIDNQKSAKESPSNFKIKNTAIIIPLSNLDNFSKYTVTVKYTPKSIFNIKKTESKTWSFTTTSGQKQVSDRPWCNTFTVESEDKRSRYDSDKSSYDLCPMKERLEKYILFPSDHDSVINGSDEEDIMYGSKKNDTILGNSGNDTIFGDDGNDIIYGGAGNDYLSGRNGDDLIYSDIMEKTRLTNSNSYSITTDEINSGQGNDMIISDGFDFVDCGLGVDTAKNMSGSKYLNCEYIK
jgi:hypothetical protein